MLHLNVAVGLIIRDDAVLVSHRQPHQYMGHLWEFPGGKCEAGESPLNALKRELQEEIGITVLSATPLLKNEYDYSDRHVVLHTFRVDVFEGEPMGCEGQEVRWQPIHQLDQLEFPQGNHEIITSCFNCDMSPDA